jgi:hypothetical protein
MIGWWLWACSTGAPPPAPPPPPPPPPRPALVVEVIVDQLPVRLLDAVAPGSNGGWARLALGYVATARHRHLATETCPGHAALSTGAAPNRSGIVANAWSVDGSSVYCVADGDARLLRTDALADRVTDAGGRAVALAVKDRAAILMGGHHPTATAWIDYAKTGEVRGAHLDALGPLPDWRCAGERTWTPLPEHVAGYAARFPDDQPFERAAPPTFPHRAPCADVRGFVASPDAGAWLVDAAIAAADHLRLGRSGTADLLAISFSQIDVIGHAHTPDSWEALDAMRRLDADLGRLFAHLDATVGAERWAVALSSDHGAPGSPRRIPRAPATAALAAARRDAGLPAAPVFEEPWVWLPPGATPAQRAKALGALRAGLAGVDGVLAVVDPADRSTWPGDDKLAEALALGVFPGRSGDLAVLRADGWQWQERDDRGTTHGSTDDLDQRVPLWLQGAGVAPGRADRDLDVRQLAPTVAALLGVDVPKDAQLPLIREALAR